MGCLGAFRAYPWEGSALAAPGRSVRLSLRYIEAAQKSRVGVRSAGLWLRTRASEGEQAGACARAVHHSTAAVTWQEVSMVPSTRGCRQILPTTRFSSKLEPHERSGIPPHSPWLKWQEQRAQRTSCGRHSHADRKPWGRRAMVAAAPAKV